MVKWRSLNSKTNKWLPVFLSCLIVISLSSMKRQSLLSMQSLTNLVVTGADPGFVLGEGALVSYSTSTPINHIVFFFLQNTSCIRKMQVISEGGGVRTPCTFPLDPPLCNVSFCWWLIAVMWSFLFQGLDLLLPGDSWFSKWCQFLPPGEGGTRPIFGYKWATEGLKPDPV